MQITKEELLKLGRSRLTDNIDCSDCIGCINCHICVTCARRFACINLAYAKYCVANAQLTESECLTFMRG